MRQRKEKEIMDTRKKSVYHKTQGERNYLHAPVFAVCMCFASFPYIHTQNVRQFLHIVREKETCAR